MSGKWDEYEIGCVGYENLRYEKKILRYEKNSGYEIVFEGMKKYLLGMKKNQFLQISHFIP